MPAGKRNSEDVGGVWAGEGSLKFLESKRPRSRWSLSECARPEEREVGRGGSRGLQDIVCKGPLEEEGFNPFWWRAAYPLYLKYSTVLYASSDFLLLELEERERERESFITNFP